MKKILISNKNISFHFITIIPNDWVVIKPNLVKESKETDPDEWESVITSPKLIREVTEYVCQQLKGTGKVTICDAPQTDSSFDKIAKKLGLHELAEELTAKYNTLVEIMDLRNEEWTNEGGIITKRTKLKGDPNGAIAFNLGKQSLFYRHPGEGRFYGADYDYKTLNKHHQGEIQEYLICATPVMADVFICLPKLKTHKKTGVTLSLKNLVGINADKNWLPHHTFGSPNQEGDEYPDISLKRKVETFGSKAIKQLAIKVPILGPKVARYFRNKGASVFGKGSNTIRSGNWHGNDTTWRMTLDLNRCLLYGNTDGTLRNDHPKRYYTIVDGEIGMEGAGPMQGTPKKCGIYIGGSDPVAVDAVAATMMGFDWEKLPVIREAFNLEELPITLIKPQDIFIESDIPEWNGTLANLQKQKHFDFEPHFGWKDHIELPNYVTGKPLS
jgi:uncharacterized protein (DUF362 family)